MKSFKAKLIKASGAGISFVVVLLLLLGASAVRGGWVSEPANPPTGNTAEPINIGPDFQVKAGDGTFASPGYIKAVDYWIASIQKWASELFVPPAPGCNWLGWKCDCIDHNQGDNKGRITLGIKCAVPLNSTTGLKVVTNFRVLDAFFSDNASYCQPPSSFPYCSIYTVAGTPYFINPPSSLSGSVLPHPTNPTLQILVKLNWQWTPQLPVGAFLFRVEIFINGQWEQQAVVPASSSSSYTTSFPFPGQCGFSPPTGLYRIRAVSGSIYSSPSNTFSPPTC